jgi:hypothetical protein
MLGKLVNKFKKQSLQDLTSAEAQQQDQPAESAPPTTPVEQHRSMGSSPPADKAVNGYQLRKSARLNVVQPAPQPEPPKVFIGTENSDSQKRQHHAQQSNGPTMLFVHDSGTESDEELEHIDSMSNASSAMNGGTTDFFDLHSPPTLTSSPPLLSEFDTNSWDSMGCESGIDINLRESSERDDISRNIDLLELEAATPVDKSHAFPVNFGNANGWDENSPSGTPPTAIGSLNRPPIDFSGLRSQNDPNGKFRCSITPEKLLSSQAVNNDCGAFQPVRRRLRNSVTQENFSESTTPPVSSPSPTGNGSIIGEKRRWERSDDGYAEILVDNTGHISPIASRTRSMINNITPNNNNNNEVPRAVLTARRTRVKVLFYDPTPGGVLTRNLAQRRSMQISNNAQQLPPFHLSESPPNNPLKRGRHNSITGANSQAISTVPVNNERPSLNFDKMRERMMGITSPNTSKYYDGERDLSNGSPRRKPQLRSASNSQSSLEASASLD